MKVTSEILIASQEQPAPPPVHEWRSLYSKDWTSDRQPRQLSVDFAGWSKSYGAVVGVPDIFRPRNNPLVSMTKTIQLWLADVLGLAWCGTPYSKMVRAQKRLFLPEWIAYTKKGRCFTDKGSWSDGYADFIQGTNLTASPMIWEVLLCGGNRIDVLDVGKVYNYPEKYLEVQGTYEHYRVRTLNVNKLPSPEAFLLDRQVCHIPTTIKPTGETGVFPQFGGRAIAPFWSKVDSVDVWKRLVG